MLENSDLHRGARESKTFSGFRETQGNQPTSPEDSQHSRNAGDVKTSLQMYKFRGYL
jgi:hypothetical protein